MMAKRQSDKPAGAASNKRVRYASYPPPSAESTGQAKSVVAEIRRHADAASARAALDKRTRTASYKPVEPPAPDIAAAQAGVNPVTGLGPT